MSTVQMQKRKAVKVKIADLIIDVFVREKTDPEYVFHLALLYESGEIIEPIEVTKSLHVIEGRHRIEAATMARLTEIEAYIVPDMPRKDMLVAAMTANLGGKRAPTRADIIGTIDAMMRSGASPKWIREQLPFPLKVTNSYIDSVQSMQQHRKINQARTLLAEGLTIEQASQQVGVSVESLQARILRKKPERTNTMSLTRTITDMNRRSGQRNRALFDEAMSAFTDGELTKEQILELAAAVENHGKLSVRAADDFRKRLYQQIA